MCAEEVAIGQYFRCVEMVLGGPFPCFRCRNPMIRRPRRSERHLELACPCGAELSLYCPQLVPRELTPAEAEKLLAEPNLQRFRLRLKTNGMPDASRLTQTMASGRFPCYNCGKVLQGALQSDAYEFEARCPRCNSVTLVCFSQAKAPARGESESIEKPSPQVMTASIERPS